jgi:hypothetical protein
MYAPHLPSVQSDSTLAKKAVREAPSMVISTGRTFVATVVGTSMARDA